MHEWKKGIRLDACPPYHMPMHIDSKSSRNNPTQRSQVHQLTVVIQECSWGKNGAVLVAENIRSGYLTGLIDSFRIRCEPSWEVAQIDDPVFRGLA
jgi:hypothetical protein